MSFDTVIVKNNRPETLEGPITIIDFRPTLISVTAISNTPISLIQIKDADGDVVGYVPVYPHS